MGNRNYKALINLLCYVYGPTGVQDTIGETAKVSRWQWQVVNREDSCSAHCILRTMKQFRKPNILSSLSRRPLTKEFTT